MTALAPAFVAKTRPSDCIVWTGALNSRGYGCFSVDGRSQLAHRVAFETERGPIPDGLTIDHLCANRRCVNVDHLEVVTGAENTRRAAALRVGGHCAAGHLLATSADLYRKPNGRRECRECRRAAKARWSARQAEAASR